MSKPAWTDPDEQRALNDRVVAWFQAARKQLHSLNTESTPNKLEIPTLKWVQATSTKAEKQPGSTKHSSTWRELARRFDEVAALVTVDTEYTRALTYRHVEKARLTVKASNEVSQHGVQLRVWLSAVETATWTRSEELLLYLTGLAGGYAKKAEQETCKAIRTSWREWARDGQAANHKGTAPTRRAFQWARDPKGWQLAKIGTVLEED